ncbi:MAG: hypothetical protein LUG12_01635 [Erysipelotrichaceae bacterium]|nr:hypothetical protein [Erysipelotrichaceae bacterium]
MKETENVTLQTKDLEKHTCCWGSDYYHCINCYYFDPNYHYGYCDTNRIDTTPDNYCSYFTDK